MSLVATAPEAFTVRAIIGSRPAHLQQTARPVHLSLPQATSGTDELKNLRMQPILM